MVTHPACVAVSVGQNHRTVSGESVCPRFLSANVTQQPLVLPDFFSFWAEHNHVCTGSVVMRRDAVLNVGGQREDLRI